MLQESEVTPEVLTAAVKDLYENRQQYIDAMAASPSSDATETIVALLKELCTEE